MPGCQELSSARWAVGFGTMFACADGRDGDFACMHMAGCARAVGIVALASRAAAAVRSQGPVRASLRAHRMAPGFAASRPPCVLVPAASVRQITEISQRNLHKVTRGHLPEHEDSNFLAPSKGSHYIFDAICSCIAFFNQLRPIL